MVGPGGGGGRDGVEVDVAEAAPFLLVEVITARLP
jgi:hypothetical protein